MEDNAKPLNELKIVRTAVTNFLNGYESLVKENETLTKQLTESCQRTVTAENKLTVANKEIEQLKQRPVKTENEWQVALNKVNEWRKNTGGKSFDEVAVSNGAVLPERGENVI